MSDSNSLVPDKESVDLSSSDESDITAEMCMGLLRDAYAPANADGRKARRGPDQQEKAAYLRKQVTKLVRMETLVQKVLRGWVIPRDHGNSENGVHPKILCLHWMSDCGIHKYYLENLLEYTLETSHYDFDQSDVHEGMVGIVGRFNNLRRVLEPIINACCSTDVAPRVLGDLIYVFKPRHNLGA